MPTKRTGQPRHERIADVLRSQIIETGEQGAIRLPTERELADIYQTTRSYVRKALDILEREGLLARTPSRGTWTVPSGIDAYRRTRRTRVIKVVTSWPEQVEFIQSAFYGQIFQGLIACSERAGYTLSLQGMRGVFPALGPDIIPDNPDRIVGAILVGVADDRIVRMHADAGYPVVSVDCWSGDPRVDAVLVDCFGEGRMIVDFLVSLGHRELFFVGNLHRARSGHRREADAELLLAGCRHALRDAGLSLPAEHTFWCPQDVRQISPVIDSLLALPRLPTAGIVFSFATVNSILNMLALRHVRCPEDVSLISKSCIGDEPDVSGVKIDAYLLGQFAVEELLERAGGKRAGARVIAVRSTLHRGPTVRSLPA